MSGKIEDAISLLDGQGFDVWPIMKQRAYRDIIAWMQKNSVSQQELANESGVLQPTICRMEHIKSDKIHHKIVCAAHRMGYRPTYNYNGREENA